MRLSLGVHYRRCSSCLRVNRISGINVYRIVSCVFSHKNWHYFLGGLDTPSLKSCLARGETPFGGCTQKAGNADKCVGQPAKAGYSWKATPVAFCGKPHNSLPGMLHGDEPCSCRPGIPRFQSWKVSIFHRVFQNETLFAKLQMKSGKANNFNRRRASNYSDVVTEFV